MEHYGALCNPIGALWSYEVVFTISWTEHTSYYFRAETRNYLLSLLTTWIEIAKQKMLIIFSIKNWLAELFLW